MEWLFINTGTKKKESRRQTMTKTNILLITFLFIITSSIQSIQADTVPMNTGTQSPITTTQMPVAPSNNSTNKAPNNAKVCTALNSGSSCQLRTRCYSCLSIKGCIFDTRSALCTAATNDFFISNVTTVPNYCERDDVSCNTCSLASSSPRCMGETGCICRSTCEIMAPLQTKCEKVRNAQNMRAWIILIGFLIIIPFMIWIQSRCVERQRSRAEANAIRISIVLSDVEFGASQPPTGRRPLGNENYPPGLTLNSWRNHLKDKDKHLVISKDLQLSTCYLMYTDEEEEAKKYDVPLKIGGPFPLLEEQRASYCETETDIEESKQSDEDDIDIKMNNYIEIHGEEEEEEEEEENHLAEIESVGMLESPTRSSSDFEYDEDYVEVDI